MTFRFTRAILTGGPWNGFTLGGCFSSQCDDEYCERLPKVLEWDGIDGRYVRKSQGSGSSTGPFYIWCITYEWEPE